MPEEVLAIQAALTEIKNASLLDFENAVRKYDIMIGGGMIFTIKLRHSLEKVFGITLTLDELHQLIPAVCQPLEMSYEPMKALNDLDNAKPAAYSIKLYD